MFSNSVVGRLGKWNVHGTKILISLNCFPITFLVSHMHLKISQKGAIETIEGLVTQRKMSTPMGIKQSLQ